MVVPRGATAGLDDPMVARIASRPVVRAAGAPLLAFASVVVGGLVGFVTLGEVGPVEAAFWLVDPTSIELHGAGRNVKAFAVVVSGGLVLSGLWAGETVATTVFGGHLGAQFRRMQQRQRIEELAQHFVVCGYGMLGRTVAAELAGDGHDVVVVEVEESNYRTALDDGLLAVHGDARREHTLADARVDRARAVVAAVDDSNVNIQIAIVTTQTAPHAELVVRVGEELYEPLARRAGADVVIIPEVVRGRSILERI